MTNDPGQAFADYLAAEADNAFFTESPDDASRTPSTEQGGGQSPTSGIAAGAAGGQTQNGNGHQVPPSSDDPLAGLTYKDLLKHPVLGREIQAAADTAAASQVRSALARERPNIEAEVRPRLQAELDQAAIKDYLEGLSPQERGTVLASDPKMAAAWGKIQQESEARQTPTAEIALTAQQIAIGTQIRALNDTIAQSDLPDDIKASLDPRNFAGQGVESLVTWSRAVQDALITHKANQKFTAEFDTRYEAERTERDANSSNHRPTPLASGFRTPITPSFDDHSGTELLEMAFQQQQNQRR